MSDNTGDPIEQSEEAVQLAGNGEPASGDPMEPQAPLVVVDDGADALENGSALPYLVTGIGASAGGVEAYIELFSSLAPDTGMAFVVVPHLLADHKSHLVEILGRHTPMPVSEIVQGGRPEPDNVYILPPGVRASLKGGVFQLENRAADGVPRSIDYFFRS